MIKFLILNYFCFGTGFYIGLAVSRRSYFKKATLVSILKGILLGVVLWPLGVYVLFKTDEYEKEK